MNNYEIRYINSSEHSFRAEEKDGKNFISGYASVFGVRSKLILENGELFYEEIERGAFDEVLQREDLDVIFTFNHSKDTVLARSTSGTLELSADDTGLFFRAEVNIEDTEAKNLWLRVKRGDISENSFAFRVSDNDYRWLPGEEDGLPIRVIDRMSDLRDVSSVTYPAYPETSLEAREHLKGLSESKKSEKSENESEIDNTKERDLNDLKFRIKIIEIKNKF